jgi:hypothetical protein
MIHFNYNLKTKTYIKKKCLFYVVNNLIDDLQHKTVNFLTKTFNYIILPNFESQKIVKKNKIRCE